MDPCVDNDPGDKEAGKAGQKSLLGQLPRTTILRIIHSLTIRITKENKKTFYEKARVRNRICMGIYTYRKKNEPVRQIIRHNRYLKQ
jgi:hypothetical protein